MSLDFRVVLWVAGFFEFTLSCLARAHISHLHHMKTLSLEYIQFVLTLTGKKGKEMSLESALFTRERLR